MFNFYNVPAMKYIFDDIDIAGAPTANQPGFLADVSELRYSQTKNRVEFVALKHASFAKKHILASFGGDDRVASVSSPSNSLIIQNKNSDDADANNLRAPSKESGIFLTSREGSISLQATDSKKRSVILGDKGLLLAADAASLDGKPQVFLSDDAVHVKFGDSFVQIKKGEVSLYAKDAGNKAVVHLNGGKVGIYSSDKTANFDAITITGDKLKGVSDIADGAIKILQPSPPTVAPAPAVTKAELDSDKRTLA
jgi:hypothetical protein